MLGISVASSNQSRVPFFDSSSLDSLIEEKELPQGVESTQHSTSTLITEFSKGHIADQFSPRSLQLRVKFRLSQPHFNISQARFSGYIAIADLNFKISSQNFHFQKQGVGFLLESRSKKHWPKIKITCEKPLFGKTIKALMSLELADNSVEAGILLTRLAWHLAKGKGFTIQNDNGENVFESNADINPGEIESLKRYSRLFRKLLFIEKMTRNPLRVPRSISKDELDKADTVFRGLVRKTVFSDIETVAIPIPLPNAIPISQNIERFKDGSTPISFDLENVEIFGQQVLTSGATIYVLNSVISNYEEFLIAVQKQQSVVNTVLESKRNTLLYTFKDPVGLDSLEQFIHELAQEEPSELALCVNEPLQGKLSKNEAIEIAVSLLHHKISQRLQVIAASLVEDDRFWAIDIVLPDLSIGRDRRVAIRYLINTQTGLSVQDGDPDAPPVSDLPTSPVLREVVEAAYKKTWVERHSAKYAGKWVALTDGILRGVGDSAEEARKKAEEQGIEPWFIFRIPTEEPQPIKTPARPKVPQLTDAERKAKLASMSEDYFKRRDELMKRLAAGVDDPQGGSNW